MNALSALVRFYTERHGAVASLTIGFELGWSISGESAARNRGASDQRSREMGEKSIEEIRVAGLNKTWKQVGEETMKAAQAANIDLKKIEAQAAETDSMREEKVWISERLASIRRIAELELAVFPGFQVKPSPEDHLRYYANRAMSGADISIGTPRGFPGVWEVGETAFVDISLKNTTQCRLENLAAQLYASPGNRASVLDAYFTPFRNPQEKSVLHVNQEWSMTFAIVASTGGDVVLIVTIDADVIPRGYTSRTTSSFIYG